MIINTEKIARKYARAFLNVNCATISEETIVQCHTLDNFLDNHKTIVCTLSAITLSAARKVAFLEKLFRSLSLSPQFKQLIISLSQHKRLFCLGSVVKNIIREYQKRSRIAVFSITTSHSLQEDEKQRIIEFIEHEISTHKIQVTFGVQVLLISGIRIKSDTLLWERSIAKFLQQVRQILFQRVEL